MICNSEGSTADVTAITPSVHRYILETFLKKSITTFFLLFYSQFSVQSNFQLDGICVQSTTKTISRILQERLIEHK